ncbi:hypothetical protein DFH09DRAFT_1405734 [Mycena vulgaris]|nr:hypothetical protein DFH09DRAFT_1405734 [Mycena vulgaris]
MLFKHLVFFPDTLWQPHNCDTQSSLGVNFQAIWAIAKRVWVAQIWSRDRAALPPDQQQQNTQIALVRTLRRRSSLPGDATQPYTSNASHPAATRGREKRQVHFDVAVHPGRIRHGQSTTPPGLDHVPVANALTPARTDTLDPESLLARHLAELLQYFRESLKQKSGEAVMIKNGKCALAGGASRRQSSIDRDTLGISSGLVQSFFSVKRSHLPSLKSVAAISRAICDEPRHGQLPGGPHREVPRMFNGDIGRRIVPNAEHCHVRLLNALHYSGRTVWSSWIEHNSRDKNATKSNINNIYLMAGFRPPSTWLRFPLPPWRYGRVVKATDQNVIPLQDSHLFNLLHMTVDSMHKHGWQYLLRHCGGVVNATD